MLSKKPNSEKLTETFKQDWLWVNRIGKDELIDADEDDGCFLCNATNFEPIFIWQNKHNGVTERICNECMNNIGTNDLNRPFKQWSR